MFKRIVAFAPVIVLCGVATYQMARAHTSDLTPWKGGGFGMFSTVDAPGARYVKVFLIDGSERYPVRVPHQLDDALRRVKCDPSQSNLDALADYFEQLGLQKLWGWTDLPMDEFQSYDDSSPTLGGPPKIRGPKSAELELQLWRLEFNAKSNEVDAQMYLMSRRAITSE